MEIKNDNKIKKLFKRFGTLGLALVFSFGVALTIGLTVPVEEKADKPVSTVGMSFGLPMADAVVVKDFADNRLQHNESLKRWEIHLAIDLASENPSVYSIYDGVVESVETNSLDGTIVKISHEDGFVSVYSSLGEDVDVKEGDVVSKNQLIGEASVSAANESLTGGHLHFAM